MNQLPIPENLRAARRSLDSISQVKVLQDWIWREDIRKWVLHCELVITSLRQELVPNVTEWFVLVSSEYPWGRIDFCPSKRNGLTHTFPHQTFNIEWNANLPWRKGNLCLSTSLRALGRHVPDVETYDVYWRLHWHFERAIQWLNAASQGTLVSPGEHFELPSFPIKAPIKIVFAEGSESFAKWQQISDSVGLTDLALLDRSESTLFVKSFRSVRGQELLLPSWGKTMTEQNSDLVTGIWIRLNNVPVMDPWQVPSTWKELRDVCREQEIELDEKLKNAVCAIRDGKNHPLLIGFPIPHDVGGTLSQMWWQALELPVLSNRSKTARGFRTNEVGYWQRDQIEILRGSKDLIWARSENWDDDEISVRGKFPEEIANKRVLIIGVGAVGSVVAELLVRGNVQRICLVDSDRLEIGNLSRHTLHRDSLGKNKASAVANQLNLASPHAFVEALETEFPWVEETRRSYIQNFDVIIDCTGSDSVIYFLEHFDWCDEKIFFSLSLGMEAKRLFCFASYGKCFPSSIFQEKIKSWLEKEHEEYKDSKLPWSGIGCWHPVFPARIDDIWMLVSVAVKYIEPIFESPSTQNDLAVFEQLYDGSGNFCGVCRVGYDEQCQ